MARKLPHDDEAKAFKTLRQFTTAIATPEGGKSAEVADPDTLTKDIAANKGKVPKASMRSAG